MRKILNFFSKIIHNKNFKILCKLFFAYVSLNSMFLYLNFTSYNVLDIILYYLLCFFFFKIKIKFDKKTVVLSSILSFCFSIILILGKNINEFMYNSYVNIILNMFTIKNLFILIGFFVLFFYILMSLFNIFPKTLVLNENKRKLSSKKVFLISFVLIIIFWIPFFLHKFPGILNSDTIGEFGMVEGIEKLVDHHPVGHAFFMGIFYNLGKTIFGSPNMGIATVTIIQMIISASIFSLVIKLLYERRVNTIILVASVIFYGILPINAFFQVTLWKDTLFSSVFLLFIIVLFLIFEKIQKKETIKFSNYLIFCIISLFMLFFRNNAIYIFLFSLPFVVLSFKDQRKNISISFIIVIVIYFIVKGPVFNCLNIARTSTAESLSIPLQQIGRMANKNINFTDEEEKMINDVIPLDTLKKIYNPVLVDDIKFNSQFNIAPINNNKLDYFKLWISLVIKHPSTALEAYLSITLGYWYPNIEYSVIPSEVVSPNIMNIYNENKAPEILSRYTSTIEPTSRKIPLFNLQWCIGILFWMILFQFVYIFINSEKKYLVFLIPIIGLWLTMMVATPVYASFRYVYGAFVTLPFILVLPFLKIKK